MLFFGFSFRTSIAQETSRREALLDAVRRFAADLEANDALGPLGTAFLRLGCANCTLPELQAAAPPGIKVHNVFDTARFVNASIDEVLKTLLEAVIIVVAVIFLFLGSFRTVLIPIVTIPLSLVGAAALMLAFGLSFQLPVILTLMGKATTLPLGMTPGMAVTVFVGTVVFSILSGVIATRRLAAADPADLF